MSITLVQKQRIASTVKDYPVVKVQLFGSRARGRNARKSDFDLLVYFDPTYTPSLFELGGLHHALTTALKADVDVVPYHPSLSPAILDHATTIFERN